MYSQVYTVCGYAKKNQNSSFKVIDLGESLP